MSTGLIFACGGAILFAMGVAGVILHDHLLRRILAFNLMGSGVFLVLIGLAQRGGAPDPVPQAMVLTGIVVAVAATALALTLTRRLFALTGGYTLPKDGDE
ncbi:MAG: NADH-quinone oxidoreductase subunit K [Rhodocyclaceae bacterium]|jgi:multicomponent Na+:H+ antiporter subunit C|nr:NADH-quinone oxidoreductase subunit K [Rhodocyclaceae bacterium]MDP2108931.1 NADH-quinone oxidoreductase subunit K [Rhodocyclaceae bacterium]MDP2194417.1 NADH-quinone oxidoreductase subunit K [Rhodocyclaceae bacterium]MDP3036478.1 NADH-quinone oxidoreductase subunit K [Rhodocyclaceae bacterium]